jgi:hypothetical protein
VDQRIKMMVGFYKDFRNYEQYFKYYKIWLHYFFNRQ